MDWLVSVDAAELSEYPERFPSDDKTAGASGEPTASLSIRFLAIPSSLRAKASADRKTTGETHRTEPSPGFLAQKCLILRKGTSCGSPGFAAIPNLVERIGGRVPPARLQAVIGLFLAIELTASNVIEPRLYHLSFQADTRFLTGPSIDCRTASFHMPTNLSFVNLDNFREVHALRAIAGFACS